LSGDACNRHRLPTAGSQSYLKPTDAHAHKKTHADAYRNAYRNAHTDAYRNTDANPYAYRGLYCAIL
jgi:hypothetical protein